MPYTNLPIEAPTPGGRDWGLTYHSANGFCFSVEEISAGARWTPQALQWIELALDACTFDVERLWAINALWDGDVFGSGAGREMRFRFFPIKSEDIPNFPKDFAVVVATNAVSLGFADIFIWEGLMANRPPYGGRLFFQETVIHALGHFVGEFLAAGNDIFKRGRLVAALMADLIRPFEFGLGVAWQTWGSGGAGLPGTPWQQQPIERYAEAFKDIFMVPTQRRFVNRTKAPFIDAEAVHAETHGYLPINGVDLPPHPGQDSFFGYTLRQRAVPARSLVAGCADRADGGLQFVCYDPKTGVQQGCPPCGPDPYDPAHPENLCSQFWLYPQSDLAIMRWGIRTRIPNLRFCDPTHLLVGAPRSQDTIPPRTYRCPGLPGVDSLILAPGLGAITDWSDGSNIQLRISIGDGLDGRPVIRNRQGLAYGDGDEGAGGSFTSIDAHGISDFTADMYLRPNAAASGPQVMDVVVVMDGYIEPFAESPADGFEFMANPVNVENGYTYPPGFDTYMYAPSAGGDVTVYGVLNLDGIDQGAASAPAAAGNEAVSADIGYRTTDLSEIGPPSLTVGGT